jgi:large subunit ribosomal protein L17
VGGGGARRNMVTQLVEHERIFTTLAKAKELRRFGDKVIGFGKENTAFGKVKARRWLRTDEAVDKLFNVLGPRYATRNGGYTRVLRAGWRSGDAAPMAIIEYVDRKGEARPARPPQPLPGAAVPVAAAPAAPADRVERA